MYKHSHLRRFYFTDWRHTMQTKTQKKRNDLPFVAGESLSLDRQRGRAWFQPPSRQANPLRHSSSGHVGSRPTAGSAASPVRASFYRLLAEPRAQDRERERESAAPRRRGREGFRTRERKAVEEQEALNPEEGRQKKKEEPRVCPPFVERGSALRRTGLRPVRGSTSLRGVSRRLSKGGVPPLRPPHAVPPPMGSDSELLFFNYPPFLLNSTLCI